MCRCACAASPILKLCIPAALVGSGSQVCDCTQWWTEGASPAEMRMHYSCKLWHITGARKDLIGTSELHGTTQGRSCMLWIRAQDWDAFDLVTCEKSIAEMLMNWCRGIAPRNTMNLHGYISVPHFRYVAIFLLRNPTKVIALQNQYFYWLLKCFFC